MHRIALRTTPARMNGFDSIKGVSNYFLWYLVPSTYEPAA